MSTRVFIIDTNVLAAGLITAEPDSPTARILDAMLEGSLLYLLSSELLSEYRSVLLRPALARLHKLREPEIDQVLTELTANAIWHDPLPDPDQTPPDPQDTHLWRLLTAEPTAILITGDKMLLENPMPRTSVISPTAWIRMTR